MKVTEEDCAEQGMPSSDHVEAAVNEQSEKKDTSARWHEKFIPHQEQYMAESTFSIIKRTYSEWSSHNAMRLAAAMSFYTMMSLAPMLVVALTLTTFIFKGGASGKIHQGAQSLVGEDGAKAVDQMLAASASSGKGGIWAAAFGFVVAIVSASGLFMSLQDAINTIWDVKPRPDAGWKAMVRARLISAALLIGAGSVAAGIRNCQHGRSRINQAYARRPSVVICDRRPRPLAGGVDRDVCADLQIPSRRHHRLEGCVAGAAITAALFILGKYGISFYFRFASTTPFGAAGSLAALLIFVYYAATLIFFGAEFTRVYAESKGKPVKPDHYAVKLTTEDRGKRGEPHPEELEEAKEKSEGRAAPKPVNRPGRAATYGMPASVGANPPSTRQYIAAGVGLTVAAALGGLSAMLLTSEERKIRTRPATALRDRLVEAERHMQRAAKVHDLLEKMSVAKRLDNVTERINETLRRADTAKMPRPRAQLPQFTDNFFLMPGIADFILASRLSRSQADVVKTKSAMRLW